MHVQAELPRLGGEGLELGRGHARKTVLLAVEQVQAEPLQFVAVGEVQQVGGDQAAVGQVAQQRVAMGEQAHLVEAREQPFGQHRSQRRRRGGAAGLVAQQGVEAGLDSVHRIIPGSDTGGAGRTFIALEWFHL
ncbi:hypothetical protein D3C80_1663390 [compost metagenome]